MSDVSKIAILDPRVKVGDAVMKIETSGLVVQPTSIPADQQGVYASTILFNSIIVPNSQQTCVSACPRIGYNVTVTVPTASGMVFPSAVAQSDANVTCGFKARPLMSVCQSANVTLNSAVSSCQPRFLLTAMQRFLDRKLLKQASAPYMPDNLGLLAIQQNTVSVATPAEGADMVIPLNASSNQPLSSYVNSTENSRNSFIAQSVAVSGANTIYTFYFEEDLYPVSPFLPNMLEAPFLYNIFNMSINLTFAGFLDMIYDTTNTNPSTYTVQVSDAQLLTTFITIDPNLVKIPKVSITDYSSPTLYVKDLGTQSTATNQFTVTSDSIRFSSCPRKIWVFVQPNINYRNGSSDGSVGGANNVPGSDCVLSNLNLAGNDRNLSNIQVTYGTSTFEVACTPRELYLEAVANGYASTYEDWVYGSGSIICLDPMKQLGFNPQTDISLGEGGSVTFRIQMNASFLNYKLAGLYSAPTNVPLQLVVIADYQGSFSASDNQQGLFTLSTVTPQEVKSLFDKPLPSRDMLPEGLKGEGAGFGKHIVHHLGKALKSDAGKAVLGMAKKHLGL